MDEGTGFGFIIAAAALYFVPAVIANYRRHRNTMAISVLTLFTSWTVIGWIIALVWAMTDNCHPPLPPTPHPNQQWKQTFFKDP